MNTLTETLFTVLEAVGTVAFAVSGATVALQRRLDVFGVMLLGLTTALGGGCIRDLLLGRTPPVMFSQPLYAIVAIATSLIVFLLAWYWRIGFFGHMVLIDRVNNIFDALGLGVFTVIGVRAGVAAGYGENAFLCVFLGLLTGVGGGVLRDMMSREIPMVLCRRVYAIASIIGGAAYFLLRTPLQESTAALTGVILVFAIRMLATHYRWSLPRISEGQANRAQEMKGAAMSFLPITKEEMTARGWEAADFVYVTGDAYVDHPSFGPAIITRLLESQGYRVAVLAQPRFDTPEDMTRFGRPRLGFLVSGGNIDSMVAHYTAARRLRSEDFYSPGCRAGLRPDRATIVYCRLIREAYGDIPIVIGGLEASLRRFAHYDYWDDAVRPSILADSGADLLIYGMGEHQMTEIAARMARGEHPAGMRDIRGTCYLCPLSDPLPENAVSCASFDKVSQDKKTYARACRLQLEEQAM